MAQPKSTDAQIEQRVTDIYKMLLQSAPRAQILQHAATAWNASERTTDEYIGRARVMLADHIAADRTHYLGLALERMNMIFGAAFEANDFANAIKAQAEICRVLGLYAPTKNEQTGANGNPLTIRLIRGADYDRPIAHFDEGNEEGR